MGHLTQEQQPSSSCHSRNRPSIIVHDIDIEYGHGGDGKQVGWLTGHLKSIENTRCSLSGFDARFFFSWKEERKKPKVSGENDIIKRVSVCSSVAHYSPLSFQINEEPVTSITPKSTVWWPVKDETLLWGNYTARMFICGQLYLLAEDTLTSRKVRPKNPPKWEIITSCHAQQRTGL